MLPRCCFRVDDVTKGIASVPWVGQARPFTTVKHLAIRGMVRAADEEGGKTEHQNECSILIIVALSRRRRNNLWECRASHHHGRLRRLQAPLRCLMPTGNRSLTSIRGRTLPNGVQG